MRGLSILPAAVLLAGCAGVAQRAPAEAMPALSLSPASLGGTLALQQRLVFRHGDRSDSVDALVEADARVLRVVLHRQGQVAMRIEWDGAELRQQRSPGLPDALSARRVLDDLQLVHWPPSAINAALPPGWSLVEEDGDRWLRQGRDVVVTVQQAGANQVRLENHREAYRLDVTSAPAQP